MVVALADERRPADEPWPPSADESVRDDGHTFAERIRAARARAASMGEHDNGAVITALVIAAHNLTEVHP